MLTADSVLNAIKETLLERGMLPTVSLDRDEKTVEWWEGDTYVSLSLWTDEDDASHLSSHRDGKTTYIRTFWDTEALAAGYRQALDEMNDKSNPVVVALEAINEFSQDYLKPLGIVGARKILFRDRDELVLSWYDSTNALCTLSIWVPELYATFSACKNGAFRMNKDFDDMDSLRASFPDLLHTETHG